MLNILEIGATVFGLIQGILVMFNKRSNWIAYVIQMLFLVLFSLKANLYGDVVNNFIYLYICFGNNRLHVENCIIIRQVI